VAPHLGLTSYLLADSFIAAIVSYATLMSMALILAKGEDYQIDANQELLAMVMEKMKKKINWKL
jgi:MFS superfamily sulfate permease-like transporter